MLLGESECMREGLLVLLMASTVNKVLKHYNSLNVKIEIDAFLGYLKSMIRSYRELFNRPFSGDIINTRASLAAFIDRNDFKYFIKLQGNILHVEGDIDNYPELMKSIIVRASQKYSSFLVKNVNDLSKLYASLAPSTTSKDIEEETNKGADNAKEDEIQKVDEKQKEDEKMEEDEKQKESDAMDVDDDDTGKVVSPKKSGVENIEKSDESTNSSSKADDEKEEGMKGDDNDKKKEPADVTPTEPSEKLPSRKKQLNQTQQDNHENNDENETDEKEEPQPKRVTRRNRKASKADTTDSIHGDNEQPQENTNGKTKDLKPKTNDNDNDTSNNDNDHDKEGLKSEDLKPEDSKPEDPKSEESGPRRSSRKRSMSPAVANPNKRFQSIAANLINNIQSHRFSSVFLQPVNKKEVPDYYEVVHEPKDLKNIMKSVKLKTGEPKYNLLKELERDVMLMFANCIMFNHSDEDLVNLARTMRDDVINTFKIFRDAEL